LADRRSGHADTIDHCPAWPAADSDLRNHPNRLINRRGCHRLRRCRNGQGKTSNSNQPDHFSSLLRGVSPPAAASGVMGSGLLNGGAWQSKRQDAYRLFVTDAPEFPCLPQAKPLLNPLPL